MDLTAFWAGPFGTQYLATLGADVIKIESVQRPDPMRFSVTVPPTTEQWYEQGSLFVAINLNKRGITLDLSRSEGRDLFLRLVATADVVVENFTPRVMENFGLAYEVLREVRNDLIMLRMPGWGLDGPWRDRPAFASTMEQASGIAWMTGRPDGPPELPGICDPLTGVHAAFAVLAALEERRRTGEGQQVELAMLDLAVNVSVEQVLEHAAYGHRLERQGNRGPAAAPQGVYPTADHAWLALAVGTDEEWQALCEVLGNADLAEDVGLRHATGRRAAHDRYRQRAEELVDGQDPGRGTVGTATCRGPRRSGGLGLRHRPGAPDDLQGLLGGCVPPRRWDVSVPGLAHAALRRTGQMVSTTRSPPGRT